MPASATRRRGALIAMLPFAMVSAGCAIEIPGRGSAAEPRALPTTAPAPPTGPTPPSTPPGSVPEATIREILCTLRPVQV